MELKKYDRKRKLQEIPTKCGFKSSLSFSCLKNNKNIKRKVIFTLFLKLAIVFYLFLKLFNYPEIWSLRYRAHVKLKNMTENKVARNSNKMGF